MTVHNVADPLTKTDTRIDTLEQVLDIITEELIDWGAQRRVFKLAQQWKGEDVVMKVAPGADFSQNIEEYDTWCHVQYTEYKKWFAKVHCMSQGGRVLIQSYVDPLPPSKAPDKMPVFLGDFKYGNYGIKGNQVVCKDYGTNLLRTTGLIKRTRKVEWRIDTE